MEKFCGLVRSSEVMEDIGGYVTHMGATRRSFSLLARGERVPDCRNSLFSRCDYPTIPSHSNLSSSIFCFNFKMGFCHELFGDLVEVKKWVAWFASVWMSFIIYRRNMKRVSLSCNPLLIYEHSTKNKRLMVKETRFFLFHAIKLSHFQCDNLIANSLAYSYCTSEAPNTMGELPSFNSLNLMISRNNQNLQFEESLRVFRRIHSSGLEPDNITCGSVLSACAASESVCFGKQVYSFAVKTGLSSDSYVSTAMIDLYAKSCNLDDAMKLFSGAATDNVVCWNAIISGCIKNRDMWAALGLFSQMVNGFSVPNGFTFSSVLTACTAVGELEMGRGLHGSVIKYGFIDDVFVGTAIVDLYAKCGDVCDAVRQFSRMPNLNVVSWTAIISGFAQKGDHLNALRYFKKMKEIDEIINKYTITTVLTACAKPAMSEEAFQVHCLILKAGFASDLAVNDALINMYAKIGKIELAAKMFEELSLVKNVRSWETMISGLVQNNRLRESVELFQEMFLEGLKPDKYSCSSILSSINWLCMGQQVHSYVHKAGLILEISVASALSTMYSKCGSIGEAYAVFEQMPEKDGVSWTSMIAGFAEHGHGEKAFETFRKMVLQEDLGVDQTTLAAVLTACSACISVRKGQEIHGYAIRRELGMESVVAGALVNMYSKCKKLASARKIFDSMLQKDHVAWSSLVSGYAQQGYDEEAIHLFRQMLLSGMEMDSFTISSVLMLLGNLTRPAVGKQLHSCCVKTALDMDQSVSSSLITMYSKCGNVEDSHKVFDQTGKPDLITWTAMITSYAQHGQGLEVLKIYGRMRKEGIAPDSVTFVGVLSACAHNGLVEEGYFHLNSMVKDYGIEPNSHHYACMVDLLGRAGRLEEAKRFIDSMPIKPDTLVWGAFLAACRLHRNVDLGRLAFENIITLEPTDEGAHVLLSNIYADLGDWERVTKIRDLMKGSKREVYFVSMQLDGQKHDRDREEIVYVRLDGEDKLLCFNFAYENKDLDFLMSVLG
ncbi:hypothetical protein H6P81_011278 [Aristolochia fimbriata]|uniref:Pentatricopeptide repeat-containing protein n=1 Tax=Aristolochia fimbriata TaxID=158543 RepID=A0AAV7ER31_ARIFI|nr:hypothetical protein H6P81_011278 [Aristolochia fimbriata]